MKIPFEIIIENYKVLLYNYHMKIFIREIEKRLREASRHFGAIVISGPRRAGKTFLLRRAFPRASYHLLEDPDMLGRIKADPRGWIEEVQTPAIIDEIQNAPELFSYIRSIIDQGTKRPGQWFLTGSQDFSLMQGVSESMAGRAAIFSLAPLSLRETGSWNLIIGGFPEMILKPQLRRVWFSSYIQTYLERDIRSLKAVKDLTTFRRFLSLLASRNGQILNKTDLAAPLGVSVPTITTWINLLETTGHVLLVPPYFDNFGKRLVKSPMVYWIDSGLLCFLLGFESEKQLEPSPFIGSVFEGFVAAEIIKNQINSGRRRELYFFRDQQGLEVDFLVPGFGNTLHLIEVKWSKTLTPDSALPLLRLTKSIKGKTVETTIVHRMPKTGQKLKTLAPGVKALGVEEFLATFPGK